MIFEALDLILQHVPRQEINETMDSSLSNGFKK
jgi:hypothetical protein